MIKEILNIQVNSTKSELWATALCHKSLSSLLLCKKCQKLTKNLQSVHSGDVFKNQSLKRFDQTFHKIETVTATELVNTPN
jgi:hypothetical protein